MQPSPPNHGTPLSAQYAYSIENGLRTDQGQRFTETVGIPGRRYGYHPFYSSCEARETALRLRELIDSVDAAAKEAANERGKKPPAKIHRYGLGFYALRHTFETIAGESRDQVAVNRIMGHVDPSMAGAYRERISDERLQDVVDVAHRWLFVRRPAK